MKKESAFWNDKHHGFVKFAVVTSLVVLLFLLFRSNGVINWIRSGHEIRRQEKMIRELNIITVFLLIFLAPLSKRFRE